MYYPIQYIAKLNVKMPVYDLQSHSNLEPIASYFRIELEYQTQKPPLHLSFGEMHSEVNH